MADRNLLVSLLIQAKDAASDVLNKVKTELEAVADESDALGKDAGGAASEIDNLGGSAEDAASSVDDLADGAEGATTGVEALGESAGGAGSGVDNLGKNADGAATNVEKLGEKAGNAESNVDDLGKRSGIAAKLISGVGAVVGTAVVAVLALIPSTIKAAAELGKLSQTTGVAVDTLTRLQLAAKLNDVPIDVLAEGVGRLSTFMTENATAARKMGLSAKDPVVALGQLADSLSNASTSQERAEIGTAALGESYSALAPLLSQGSKALFEQVKAGEDVGGITQQMAREALELSNQVEILTFRFKAFITGVIVPAIKPLAALTGFFKSLGTESVATAQSIEESHPVYAFAAKLIGGVALVADRAARALRAMAAKVVAIKNLDFSALDAIDEAFDADNEAALKNFNNLLDELAKKPDITIKPEIVMPTEAEEQVKQFKSELDGVLDLFKDWQVGAETSLSGIASGLRRVSENDLAEFKRILVTAFETGIDRTEALKDALDAIKTEEVTRAWQELGGASERSLNQAADAARKAYVTIRDSGTASSADLVKSWALYTNKIKDAAAAINQVDGAERQRAANLASLQDGGGEINRLDAYLAVEKKKYQVKDQLREEDFAGAVKTAQEAEALAFKAAEAEKKAFENGEGSSYERDRAIQAYKESIENTTQALDALANKQLETGATQDAEAPQQDTSGLDQTKQAVANLKAELTQLTAPIVLNMDSAALDVTEEKLNTLLQLTAQLQSAQIQAVNTVNQSADVAQQISREALARGRR